MLDEVRQQIISDDDDEVLADNDVAVPVIDEIDEKVIFDIEVEDDDEGECLLVILVVLDATDDEIEPHIELKPALLRQIADDEVVVLLVVLEHIIILQRRELVE